LKLKCDEPLSNDAFNFSLRRYMKALEEAAAAAEARKARKAAKAAKAVGGRVAAAVAAEEEEAVPVGGAWVLDLAALLLAHESASAAVDALVDTMQAGRRETPRTPETKNQKPKTKNQNTFI
jgi:hypothetical protein